MKLAIVSGVLLVTLAGCGGAKPTPPSSRASNDPVANVVGAAAAEVAKLQADYTCTCIVDGATASFCEKPIIVEIPSDSSMDSEASPHQNDTERGSDALDSCWGELALWEIGRGASCFEKARDPNGKHEKLPPRPSCGTPPAYKLATVEPWWTAKTPCPGKQKLVTAPNPMKPGALLAAYCATVSEVDTLSVEPGSRVTQWYVNGSVLSDRTGTRRTDWYPHGQISDNAETGEPPPSDGDFQSSPPVHWTHYFPNGQVSDRGDRTNGELTGTWEGFRYDGTPIYRSQAEMHEGETVVWLDRTGQPVQKREDSLQR